MFCYHKELKEGYALPGSDGEYHYTRDGLGGILKVSTRILCFPACSKDHSLNSKDSDANGWECPWYLEADDDARRKDGATSFE